MTTVCEFAVSGNATVSAVSRHVRGLLGDAGISTPALDARVIITKVLGLDHAQLIAGPDRALPAGAVNDIMKLADRRAGGEPVSRLFGEREFFSRCFAITPATLDPRPETELLVEQALVNASRPDPRVLDLGTGSGAIIVTLLAELPQAHGVAVDISCGALDVTRANARRHRVDDRLTTVETNWGKNLSGPFDLIVSNPPYIAAGDLHRLPVEVAKHDPHEALLAGVDGLDCYRSMAGDVARLLAPDGAFFCEFGEGQYGSIAGIFARAGLAACTGPAAVACDLAGIERIAGFCRSLPEGGKKGLGNQRANG